MKQNSPRDNVNPLSNQSTTVLQNLLDNSSASMFAVDRDYRYIVSNCVHAGT